MRTLALIAATAAFAVTVSNACVQSYPARPVKLVVPDSAGGAPDRLARLLAEKLSIGLGQQVVVANRAGAGGVLGAEAVALSATVATGATPAADRGEAFAEYMANARERLGEVIANSGIVLSE